MESVDGVDKYVALSIFATGNVVSYGKNVENAQSGVDSVDKSLTKQLFADGDDISRPHSYQQIAVCTIFQ